MTAESFFGLPVPLRGGATGASASVVEGVSAFTFTGFEDAEPSSVLASGDFGWLAFLLRSIGRVWSKPYGGLVELLNGYVQSRKPRGLSVWQNTNKIQTCT